MSNALEKVLQLEGFYYTDNATAQSLGIKGGRRKVGLSAQKLEQVLPETVIAAPFDTDENIEGDNKSKSGENYLTAQYERVVPLLVEAIKEQQSIISAQQGQIDELKAMVTQLLNK